MARNSSTARRHVLLTPAEGRGAELVDWLENAGGRSVQQFPGSAILAILPAGVAPDPTLADVQELSPANKIAPTLIERTDAEGFVILEFHQDVDAAEAINLVFAAGLIVRENPDLAPHHVLAQGSYAAAISLAESDEVAYVFEASPELAEGTPVMPCAGFASTTGSIGQYIASVGEGWDGVGRNATLLGYTYGALTNKQSRDLITSNIERALGEWSKAAAVSFLPGTSATAARNLHFLFASGDHSDGYPFDGSGKVLAHTFYPAPPNPEPLAGDLHFDADENWNIGADIDVFSVVLHELGHALGLGHSDKPAAVMYPYYKRVSALTAEDISAILTLYAAPGTSGTTPQTPLTLIMQDPGIVSTASVDLAGSVTGGSGDVRVSWSDTRGHSGVASGTRTWVIAGIPLVPGANSINIAVQDAANSVVSRTINVTRTDMSSPVITISAPASGNVTQPIVTVQGSASQSTGIVRVTWSNSRGGSGIANGTMNWSATITLLEGTNTLTMTAYAANGAWSSTTVTLNYVRLVVPDTTSPSLTVLNPGQAIVRVTTNTFSASGTAVDNVGVVEVRWSTNFSYSGIATGTTRWSAPNIPLLVGDNVVTIRAKDAAGNVGWRSFTIVRR